MNSRQLHLVALTADQTIRQAIETAPAEAEWRFDIEDDTAGLVGAISTDTHIVVIDEASADTGFMGLVRRVRRAAPAVEIIAVGGPKSQEVEARERSEGVNRRYERPIDESFLRSSLSHRMELAAFKSRSGIVGQSPALEEVLEAVLQVAPTEVTILIEGESGTGKDVIARAVHEASRRADKPFEAVNCGALAEGVLESELFGHERGAFTGAVSRRAGLFERANGGTVFLDEVGEMSSNMQVRLLRVLESGEVLRVGGHDGFRVDVRVIAATNRRLADDVAQGKFRQDLYYRLKGINLRLPPLRERREDIAVLAHHFMVAANRRHQTSVRGLEDAALDRLRDYHWPGNIRELRNLIDTLVVLASGPRITAELVSSQLAKDDTSGQTRNPLLPVALNRSREEAEREMIYASILALHRDVQEILALLRGVGSGTPLDGLKEVRHEPSDDVTPLNLNQMERTAIQDALARFGGNRRKAADSLGISERTLYRKIKEYGLV